MSAADKIQAARALIEPLTGHDDGPWVSALRGTRTDLQKGRDYHRVTTLGDAIDPDAEAIVHVSWRPHRRANAALIAASPDLRDTVAALADLADAQAQENAELRAENERLRNMALLARFSEVFAGSHRHLKSGGLYDHIGTGRIQSEQPLTDMDAVEIYIGVNGDLWARRQAEFHDGRFDEISPAIGDAP